MKKVAKPKKATNSNHARRAWLWLQSVTAKVWAFIKRRKWVQVLLGLIFILLLTIIILGISFSFKHRNDPVEVGVSFSQKYAQELGNDWQQNLLALLQDANFKKIRFMSYWDTIEPNKDEYDFSDLDWQMDRAAENGASVSLAVGLRQPRWPECHYPGWARDLSLEESQAELLVYLEEVVTRYRNHPALESYQLENEIANKRFGDCPDYDREFYAREFALIRSLDSENLLITNVSNQSGFQIASPVGDKVGFSVYKRAHFIALGRQVPWSFWYVPPWWHGMRAMAVETLHGADTFIHELQAEPWGPKPTIEMTVEEQFKTMDPDKFVEITNYAEATGMKEYYLWGGEWWYWLMTEKGDYSMWQIAKTKVESTQIQN